MLDCVPFAPGERYTMMWGCCAGTHASSVWQNNGLDAYAGPGTTCVAPISGEVVRAGVPGIGQGERVGIQGATHSVYMAHMTALRVHQGDRVQAGDPVGVIWDWGTGMPSHLHFSVARGSYGGGTFVDPWDEVARLGVHINGRVYEAPRNGKTPNAVSASPPEAIHYVEEMPHKLGGEGPDVYGPWRNTPAHQATRAATIKAMQEKGRLAVAMNDHLGDLYIYVYPNGSYGDAYRFGPWASATSAERAQAALVANGRLTKPRRFTGRANSLYPWI